MVSSKASSVDDYLDELPDERRDVVAAVRNLVVKNLPKGYREVMGYGMITYIVPFDRYPDTYNKQPLCYVALAAQKNHYALYLTSPYSEPGQEQWLRDEYEKAGKKLDMGKSCVRFKNVEELEQKALAKVIASTSPDEFIERYEKVRAATTKPKTAAKAKPATKKK